MKSWTGQEALAALITKKGVESATDKELLRLRRGQPRDTLGQVKEPWLAMIQIQFVTNMPAKWAIKQPEEHHAFSLQSSEHRATPLSDVSPCAQTITVRVFTFSSSSCLQGQHICHRVNARNCVPCYPPCRLACADCLPHVLPS